MVDTLSRCFRSGSRSQPSQAFSHTIGPEPLHGTECALLPPHSLLWLTEQLSGWAPYCSWASVLSTLWGQDPCAGRFLPLPNIPMAHSQFSNGHLLKVFPWPITLIPILPITVQALLLFFFIALITVWYHLMYLCFYTTLLKLSSMRARTWFISFLYLQHTGQCLPCSRCVRNNWMNKHAGCWAKLVSIQVVCPGAERRENCCLWFTLEPTKDKLSTTLWANEHR